MMMTEIADFTPAAKTREELLGDRQNYMQRILKLGEEEEQIKDRLADVHDETMQIRGALAYVEMSLEELDQKDIATQKEIEAQNKPD